MVYNKENKIKFLGFVFLFSIFYFIVSVPAQAQSLSLSGAKSTYYVGDTFSVSLNLDTGGQIINTISGVIRVPPDKFQIMETRYGNSIILLWVEKPKINNTNGTISFTGGVPGGFSGSDGPILSFTLKAKKKGSAILYTKDIKVLLNDGQGTELSNVAFQDLSLNIAEAPAKKPVVSPEKEEPQVEEFIPAPDTVPPENFMPIVSRNPSIENNKYFASFFAVDKDTGVSRYEIMEKPLILSYITSRFDKPLLGGESLFILRGQYWAYKVVVRAYDQAGNYTDGITEKPFHPFVILIFILLLIVLTALITYFISRPRRRRK